jgi:5-formyltetrahydrofolate cyclo-ligase
MEKSNKNDLRKKFAQKRDRLTPVARARDSAIIRQRVFNLPEWKKARTILAYVSFRSEVETHSLIQDALNQNKRMVLPVIDPTTKTIHLSELKTWGDLAAGAHGIFEPAEAFRKRVEPFEVNLVLVPGLAFDRGGGRLGMGGGYFDKLLVQIPATPRIALAYSIQVQKTPLPMHDHDIHMQAIVTEKEVIRL